MIARCLMAVFLIAAGMALFPASDCRGEAAAVTELAEGQLSARIEANLDAVRIYRKGLRSTLAFMASQPRLFPEEKLGEARVLSSEDREVVCDTWKSVLDYILALDSVGRFHRGFYKLDTRAARRDSFLAGYAAFLAQYSFALKFIGTVENDSGLDTILNEPLPQVGLPERTYAKFKFRFLNAGRATEFGALATVYKWYGGRGHPAVRAGIDRDAQVVWDSGKGPGPLLTAKNALKIVRDAGFTAWFPVQAGISEWMGDVKVYRKGRSLITSKQIAAMADRLEPGDVLLERREWYLSNVGLPGFWPHAALFIGTPETRRAFLDDPEVRAWVREQGRGDGDFEGLLRGKFPGAYRACLAPHEDGHRPQIIEAMSEGVIFTTLEHSAAADSLAVLRPRLRKRDKALAILRAFSFVGRPYDFDFDFLTDAALVCTEVIYKAYEPSRHSQGLRLPLVEIMGRQVTPANEIARQFHEQYGTPAQQMDLVLFLDGHERRGIAVEATVEAFRRSRQRPKWHVLTQDLE